MITKMEHVAFLSGLGMVFAYLTGFKAVMWVLLALFILTLPLPESEYEEEDEDEY